MPLDLDEVLDQLNRRFAPGAALREMTENQKQFQIFRPANSLAQIYRLLDIGPADHVDRRRYFQFLDFLSTIPSDMAGVNGHDRIFQAQRQNLESKLPLPMYFVAHDAAIDPRVLVSRSQLPTTGRAQAGSGTRTRGGFRSARPNDQTSYVIVSIPIRKFFNIFGMKVTFGYRDSAEEEVKREGEDVRAEYTIWYGTNRLPNQAADRSKGYSARRSNTVHYGSCRVFVPKSHKFGSTGSRWWKRFASGKDDRLRLIETQALNHSIYWEEVSAHLASMAKVDKFGVVFVHGYNVSFEQAALRAAQIGFDLKVKSAMSFFSWPSRGTVRGYSADEAAIEASESAITDYLVDFCDRSGAEKVHIIAHSMGNRGVANAIQRIAEQVRRRRGQKFGQIILAAPDVDAELFRQRCAALHQVAQRTTLYVSSRDRAIEASRWLHDFPRAGLIPPVLVAPGIDTINVTNADLTLLGHGYVAEANDVLHDIYELILRGTPPERRAKLREEETHDKQRYWTIAA